MTALWHVEQKERKNRSCLDDDESVVGFNNVHIVTPPHATLNTEYGTVNMRVAGEKKSRVCFILTAATRVNMNVQHLCYPFQTQEWRRAHYARTIVNWVKRTTDVDIVFLDSTGVFPLSQDFMTMDGKTTFDWSRLSWINSFSARAMT